MPDAGPNKFTDAASSENVRADAKVETPATADPIKKDLLEIPVINVSPQVTVVCCKMIVATTNR